MGYNFPTIDEFKTFFYRDFPFGSDPATSVTDTDIGNAFQVAQVNWNPDFWCSQQQYTLAFDYLAAHYLCMNINNSSQGLNGQFNWGEVSKSAGNVSQGFQIPQRILDNPELMLLTKTNYGAMYLQMILPQLAGQMVTVWGRTRP